MDLILQCIKWNWLVTIYNFILLDNTIIATVGYGDINGSNDLERIFCSIIMIIVECGFSYANWSLTSILYNFD